MQLQGLLSGDEHIRGQCICKGQKSVIGQIRGVTTKDTAREVMAQRAFGLVLVQKNPRAVQELGRRDAKGS